jgi:hypothetical protein
MKAARGVSRERCLALIFRLAMAGKLSRLGLNFDHG